MAPRSFLKLLLDTLGSLRLSVILLFLSVLLVFFGTLDQVRIGTFSNTFRFHYRVVT